MNVTSPTIACAAVFAIVLLCAPRAGSAEWYGSVYLGASHTEASANRFELGGATVRSLETSDDSSLFGGRLGYWLESRPWLGVAADASVFTPDFEDVTMTVAPVSALLMARLPLLEANEYPRGRLQAYLGAGPGLFFTSVSEFVGPAVAPPAVLEDSSLDLGLDLRVGVAGAIGKRIQAFIEYRYTDVDTDLESMTGSGAVRYAPSLETHHVLVGVSVRFAAE